MIKQRVSIIGLLSIVLIIGYACQDLPSDPDNSEQGLAVHSQKLGSNAHSLSIHEQQNFRTHLKGENEVLDDPDETIETNAQGQATFKVSKDGTSISYKLIVANIENVLMAHIHLAPAGVNGPVVVWLYPSEAPPQLIPGRSQGVLAEGTISADNLVGLLAGQTLDDLIEEIKAGNTYVNVHTSQYPAGEIRGQIH